MSFQGSGSFCLLHYWKVPPSYMVGTMSLQRVTAVEARVDGGGDG
jgi:hypothetical protein